MQHDEDFYLVCASTGVDLLSIEDGIKKVHHSHGQCSSCGLHFSIENLETKGMDTDRWPVIYEGLTCTFCCRKE